MTGWKKPRSRHAGPHLLDGKPRAQWVPRTGGPMPAVGGSGRSPFLHMAKDAREAAYARMCDELSNRWRTHRTRSGGGT
jgi:hypothetical protein